MIYGQNCNHSSSIGTSSPHSTPSTPHHSPPLPSTHSFIGQGTERLTSCGIATLKKTILSMFARNGKRGQKCLFHAQYSWMGTEELPTCLNNKPSCSYRLQKVIVPFGSLMFFVPCAGPHQYIRDVLPAARLKIIQPLNIRSTFSPNELEFLWTFLVTVRFFPPPLLKLVTSAKFLQHIQKTPRCPWVRLRSQVRALLYSTSLNCLDPGLPGLLDTATRNHNVNTVLILM